MDDGEATSSRLRRSHASLSPLSGPVLESCKKLEPEFDYYNRIPITSDNFSIGSGMENSVILSSKSLTRNHCQFKKGQNNEWTLEDNSTFGIKINGVTLGKGLERKLCDGDIISLALTGEFVYKFLNSPSEEVPRKRLKMEDSDQNNKKMTERGETQKQLNETQNNAEKSFDELRMRVTESETELAALAAERIEKQAVQSRGVVINDLQEHPEKVESQVQTVETEMNTISEDICAPDNCGKGSSKENEMRELMESELQCSICNELFVEPTTLNCSHTFCKYCISAWKKKKKNCPICRTAITSECKNLALNSFIEKMVQRLSEEMKRKRKEILEERKELESRQGAADGPARIPNDEEEEEELEEEEEEEENESGREEDIDAPGGRVPAAGVEAPAPPVALQPAALPQLRQPLLLLAQRLRALARIMNNVQFHHEGDSGSDSDISGD